MRTLRELSILAGDLSHQVARHHADLPFQLQQEVEFAVSHLLHAKTILGRVHRAIEAQKDEVA